MRKVTRYHFWNAETKKYLGDTGGMACDVKDGGIYVHQAFEIDYPDHPDFPEPPKKELPDGLYHALDLDGDPVTVSRRNRHWYSSGGTIYMERREPTIIGRIPVEPVDGGKS